MRRGLGLALFLVTAAWAGMFIWVQNTGLLAEWTRSLAHYGPVISQCVLAYTITLAAFRSVLLVVEKSRGMASAETPEPGSATVGPLTYLLDALIAYTYFLTGATVLTAITTDDLSRAVPDLPVEAKLALAGTMVWLLAQAALRLWRVFRSIVDSPLFQPSIAFVLNVDPASAAAPSNAGEESPTST